ncbi:MAG: hypothetical protein JSU58_04180 [Dehalococcoidales bacterium]|nr:MAG: hypothetical protein JSU58_04180 [Dehalococcoidales bacterium]
MKRGFIRKRCTKCGGNVYFDSDLNGWYEKCFQCGFTNYMEIMVELQQTARKNKFEQVANNKVKTIRK